jgi:hypothetical protein
VARLGPDPHCASQIAGPRDRIGDARLQLMAAKIARFGSAMRVSASAPIADGNSHHHDRTVSV